MPLASLTISQNFGGQGGMMPAVMSVKVTQAGYETRRPFVLDLRYRCPGHPPLHIGCGIPNTKPQREFGRKFR